jgi:hypothetical protein
VRTAALALGKVFLSTLLAAGCVDLHKGGLYPADHDRVFVEYFYNETFYRDVEFQLGDAVVAEIVSRPGLRLSSKEDAEVVLRGRVLNIQQHVLSENPQLNPTSESTEVTVEVRLEDARTGEVIKTQRLTEKGEFVQALGQSVEVGRATALRFLARDIVRVLEEDF